MYRLFLAVCSGVLVASTAIAATPGEPFPVDEIVVSEVPLVYALEPEYETLTLEIKSGDTLDKLFRRHDLDLGNLSVIASLDEAKAELGQMVEVLKNPRDWV